MTQRSNQSASTKFALSEDKAGLLAPEMVLQADIATGQAAHVKAQLSATPGTVLSITNVPSWARYVILYPESALISYAFGENPACDAANAGSGNAIDFATQTTVGNVAPGGQVTVRAIVPGANADLRLVSDTGSAIVWVGFSAG